MPVVGADIGQIRFAFGVLALAGCLLAMWFSVLFQPLIYGLVVVSTGLWIGLWPFNVPKLGHRLLIACAGSVGTCVVLIIAGERIALVRRDGLEEFGPLLFVPAFTVAMGLPIAVSAVVVAAIAPILRGEPATTRRKSHEG